MTSENRSSLKVAVIGSFRQHYDDVCGALKIFYNAGIEVTSPKGTDILEEGIPFVRFESDHPDWDDQTVQTIALHRILRATAVYVVAPGGYVGRTTCYEVGRVIQADRPIYFSSQPVDLPIAVPDTHVADPERLVEILQNQVGAPLFRGYDDQYSTLERRLVVGDYSSF